MRAFTLIETVIYLALLSLLMLGCVSLAWGVGGSTKREQLELQTVEEGVFVVAKLRAAVQQSSRAEEPDATRIRLYPSEGPSLWVEFEHDDNVLYIRREGDLRVALTTLPVTETTFVYEDEVLHAHFVIGGREFSTTFHLP